ncbi:MAG: hypothetical protein EBZ82_05795, partial [Burkholderiaceae bacterium]|nr:hypothetical protein [Burkholderiaceae bacterium]
YYVGDSEYQIKSVGTNLKFGVPYTEVDRVFFGSGFELFDINVTQNTPQPYQNYANAWGVRTPPGGRVQTYNIPATIGWARDGRDSALIPSKGSLQRLSGEVGTPLGNLMFYQLNAQYQQYHSFSKGNILSFNGELGYGEAYGSKPFPITKNYFVGGIGSVRGYAPGSLGPKYYNTTVGTWFLKNDINFSLLSNLTEGDAGPLRNFCPFFSITLSGIIIELTIFSL